MLKGELSLAIKGEIACLKGRNCLLQGEVLLVMGEVLLAPQISENPFIINTLQFLNIRIHLDNFGFLIIPFHGVSLFTPKQRRFGNPQKLTCNRWFHWVPSNSSPYQWLANSSKTSNSSPYRRAHYPRFAILCLYLQFFPWGSRYFLRKPHGRLVFFRLRKPF